MKGASMTAKKQPEHELRLAQIDGQPVAVCSCGEQSEPLSSVPAANDWHTAHTSPAPTAVDVDVDVDAEDEE